MTTRQQLADKYAADNMACALSILANPAKYGGPDSLMCQWAQLVLQREREGQERPALPWRLVA